MRHVIDQRIARRITFTLEVAPGSYAGPEHFQAILSGIEAGDLLAWTLVTVTARSGPFIGRACLGDRRRDLREFRTESDFHDTLTAEALDDLHAQIARTSENDPDPMDPYAGA